ncbi:hypothetical protein [Streptomyces sp. NPDC057107]|uniref:hypothetical protein n=1 Tax=unclassified Streptomyces TaxID=2593676 RepID=UPI0017B97A06|nr:hypothetical protein [Streptomyces sp. SJ1-7]
MSGTATRVPAAEKVREAGGSVKATAGAGGGGKAVQAGLEGSVGRGRQAEGRRTTRKSESVTFEPTRSPSPSS